VPAASYFFYLRTARSLSHEVVEIEMPNKTVYILLVFPWILHEVVEIETQS
jgi:hypothetical protein